MGMGQEMMEEGNLEEFRRQCEEDAYERRVIDTGAGRLAYMLHEMGVLSDYHLVQWLYPEDAAMEQAEKGAVP